MNIKPFSEDITTGSFKEIELSTGSPEWRNLLAKIAKWKREGGILQAKLKGESQPIGLPVKAETEERMEISDDVQEARRTFLNKSSAEKVKELEWLEWQAGAELRYPKPLLKEELEEEWDRFLTFWKSLSSEEITTITKDLDQLGLFDKAPYSELNLKLGSPDWQKLREEIKRWKKTGGVLKAKLKGKEDEVQQEKRISELVSKRGPALTTEEQDEIAATPGIIPPWWEKPSKDSYYAGASKAIKKLGVSALDVHLAVEKDYTDKPITEKQKEILRVGWGYPIQDVGYGEYDEKSKLAATSSNLAKYLLTKQGLKVSAKTFGRIVAKISGTMMSPWLIPLIWSPEIIDIARSKDIQKVWKNMQSETWWKEAAKRDEIVREKAKRGEKVVFSKNIIPFGEFYHRDKGWY